jgi:hypothetical protein
LAQAARTSYENSKTTVQQDQADISQVQDAIEAAESGESSAAKTELPAAQAQLSSDNDQLSWQYAAFSAGNAQNTGLLDRINALDEASAASPGLQAGRWLLFLVFLLIDCLPALMAITHALNGTDDYEKAIAEAAAIKARIVQLDQADQVLDADSLSRQRARIRDATASGLAEAEQHVQLHGARQWVDWQTGGPRPAAWPGRRPGGLPARSQQRNPAPPRLVRPQVFIRQYTPPPGPGQRNGHAPSGDLSGETP